MGKKRDKDQEHSRKINVEIAPGNQQAMDAWIQAYNHKPERKTPKIKYTDVVNEALDRFLSSHAPARRAARVAGKEK